MEQYVSKAALVTEIEKRIADNKKEIERASHKNLEDYFEGYEDALTLFKEQFLNTLEVKEIWKPADGDDLPEIDREVIVLYQPYPCEGNEYVVGFAHRPKEYWDGRNIETDEVTRYYPKRYDKGGWNIPDVKWWLDSNIEKLNNNEKEEI